MMVRPMTCRAVSARTLGFRHSNASRQQKRHRRNCTMQAADTETSVTPEMLEVAQLLADEAAAVTTPLFRAKLVTDIKEDQTPVTDADREAERLMREMIRDKLPLHSVFGEEYGYEPGDDGVLYFHLPPHPPVATKSPVVHVVSIGQYN